MNAAEKREMGALKIGDTKENILLAALCLFARKGYEAVSVSEIAGALGMTKGALYKHYKNKRDIFDQIVARMETLDARQARQYRLPEEPLAAMEDSYRKASMQQVLVFSLAQFHYWTREEFPSAFRKLLTLEQYRSEEMRALYQQYFAAGPLGYITDLFAAWGLQDAKEKAAAFYAPMFLSYSLYDGAADKAAVSAALQAHMERFAAEWNIPR